MPADISQLNEINGFIGGCLVDIDSGAMLAAETGTGALDLAAAGVANTEVVRSKNAAMKALGLKDHIEDILITRGTQYHLIRPLAVNSARFLYIALDKDLANLGKARLAVKDVEEALAA